MEKCGNLQVFDFACLFLSSSLVMAVRSPTGIHDSTIFPFADVYLSLYRKRDGSASITSPSSERAESRFLPPRLTRASDLFCRNKSLSPSLYSDGGFFLSDLDSNTKKNEKKTKANSNKSLHYPQTYTTCT